jgi:hypothetical protein
MVFKNIGGVFDTPCPITGPHPKAAENSHKFVDKEFWNLPPNIFARGSMRRGELINSKATDELPERRTRPISRNRLKTDFALNGVLARTT